MANLGAILAGLILFAIAFIGYTYPISDNGYTIPQYDQLCDSGVGQLGQLFSRNAQQDCGLANTLVLGTYGIGLIGLILFIVGLVVPKR